MPLSATYRGERVESWSMSEDEWTQLKTGYRAAGLTMMCGQQGVPKTSKLGTRFFAHKPGTDCLLHEGGPESQEHLATKAVVARAAREIGWDATVECPAPDRSWIADVLVSNGNRRLAIEAQWSPQTDADFERRQKRYEATGLECVWLAGPRNVISAGAVPHYAIDGSVGSLEMQLPILHGSQSFDLADGIKRLLGGGIRPIAELIVTRAAVQTQMVKCWHCSKWGTLWTVTALELESRCGQTATLEWSTPWELHAAERHEKALEEHVLRELRAADLPPAVVLQMRRTEAAGVTYLAMICRSCNRLQGDGMLPEGFRAGRSGSEYTVPLGKGVRLPFADWVVERAHVCEDIGRGRCVLPSSTTAATTDSAVYPPATEHVYFTGWRMDAPALPQRS